MNETIRLSCDCKIRQGEGFVHLCPAHNDLIGDLVHGEREACAKIVDDECARVLAKQTGDVGFSESVDLNLRLCAVLLPDLAAKIRTRANTN